MTILDHPTATLPKFDYSLWHLIQLNCPLSHVTNNLQLRQIFILCLYQWTLARIIKTLCHFWKPVDVTHSVLSLWKLCSQLNTKISQNSLYISSLIYSVLASKGPSKAKLTLCLLCVCHMNLKSLWVYSVFTLCSRYEPKITLCSLCVRDMSLKSIFVHSVLLCVRHMNLKKYWFYSVFTLCSLCVHSVLLCVYSVHFVHSVCFPVGPL